MIYVIEYALAYIKYVAGKLKLVDLIDETTGDISSYNINSIKI